MRNDERMRKAYRYESSNIVTYRDAFSSDFAYCFDEQKAFGRYCHENGIETCDNFTFFDIDYRHDDYRIPLYEKEQFEYDAHNVFAYQNGKLFLLWVKRGTSEIHQKEILYAQMDIDKSCFDRFMVWGDSFRAYKNKLNAEDIKKYDPKSFKRHLYIKILWKKIKAEYLHGSGVKYYKYPY